MTAQQSAETREGTLKLKIQWWGLPYLTNTVRIARLRGAEHQELVSSSESLKEGKREEVRS